MERKRRSLGISIVLLGAFAGAGRADARGVIVDGRLFHLHVPARYDGSKQVPLVILIHGIGVSSTLQDAYMRVKDESDARGFIYAYPDGTRLPSPVGQFWNGANCCQPPLVPPVDDEAYLDHIIQYVRSNYKLDERQIFLIGHSNGAFMANRYACHRSQVAAIVTLSGAQYLNPLDCGLPFLGQVAVLHIHGTYDEVTPYLLSLGYPPAPLTVFNWATRNGCFHIGAPGGAPLDLVSDIPGNETSRKVYACLGGALEFWTINGGYHVPNFYQRGERGRTFGSHALDWLLAHGRR